jgi:hypothetical protein
MAHGDAREGKWKGNWRIEWVASTLHTTSEHGASSVTTADAHTSAASSRLNWRPRRFKWTRPFRRKTKSGFCACAITFQMQSTRLNVTLRTLLVLFFSPKRPDCLRDRPTPLFNKHRRVNPRGREADHSSPSSAEVKNQWSYTFTPPYTLMARTAKILIYRMS